MKKAAVFIIFVSLISCMWANNRHQTGPGKPAVFALDAAALAASKSKLKAGNAAIMPAYKQLIKEADAALKYGPVSVMEKKNSPPSGDKHDYMSLAPYHWPDPSKPDGLPYIRKDGGNKS